MIIIGGSNCKKLAEKTAKHLGAELVELEVRSFPDGETYVRVKGEVKGENVALIQSLARNPNEALVELALAADACRGLECNKLIGVIPYMAYARQDARFNPGEPISINVLAKMLSSIGFDVIITVDMHLHRIKDVVKLFSIPFQNLTATPLIAEHFSKSYPKENFIVVGPDEESRQWVSKVSEILKADYVIFEKERLSPTEVLLTSQISVDLRGKTALIVDDVISTGTTIAEAVKMSFNLGASKVYAACVHPLLTGSALNKIMSAGAATVVGTDSVDSSISVISLSPLLSEALQRWS
ncbi:MAG: ribose-phosphate diphosphokinase [Candidatus Methanomethylicota archaeon]|uniref:Ribose-phosphate pyrophosphokinase n=1 Tax=Thermoproteota archaeon TaxID=2056631 RepID=A0A497EVN0_9CREN|nr:MAG: ribose-phosphate diphosphokinase [Candidatus Verstraetearchaeota archaeon]